MLYLIRDMVLNRIV